MRKIYILFLLSVFVSGCYKEENIRGREGGEPFYTLPQGNHVYDKDIVEWFEHYGFYTLYDFDEKDLYWNNSEWEQSGMLDYGLTGKLLGYKADMNHVEKQVELFKKLFLNRYPGEMLKQGMPLKVLLCSKLQEVKNVSRFDFDEGEYKIEQVYVDIWARRGYDYIAINGRGDWMKSMTDSLITEYSLACNTILLKLLGEKGVLKDLPAAFFEVSSEHYGNNFRGRGTKLFKAGLLTAKAAKAIVEVGKNQDFFDYLNLVGYPLSVLEGKPGTSDDERLYPSLRGVFRPDLDANGLVRKKYDIMIDWLRAKGVDVKGLQHPCETK